MRLLGFFLILLFFMYSNCAFASAKMTGCQKAKDFQSELHVIVDMPDIEYDLKKSKKFLTNNQKEALKEWQSKQEDIVWASSDRLEVDGLARGGVGVETEVRLIAKPYDRYGNYYCPYIERLTVKFFYKSTIFIASEYKEGGCDFNATREHELKHHDANVGSVRDVVAKFKQDLPKMVSYMERRYIKKDDVGAKFSQMKKSIRDAFEVYSDVIVKEMTKRNDLIDTPTEYERVMALCP